MTTWSKKTNGVLIGVVGLTGFCPAAVADFGWSESTSFSLDLLPVMPSAFGSSDSVSFSLDLLTMPSMTGWAESATFVLDTTDPPPCIGVADCCDLDGNGVRDDPCLWCECVANACVFVNKDAPSDMGGAFGDCPSDTFCNVHDANLALQCFAGLAACEDMNVDAGGPFGACAPDGFCNVHDRNHALTCFSGENPCSCSGGPAPEYGPVIVDHATLTLAPSRWTAQPGETVEIRVFIDKEAVSGQLSAVSRSRRVEPALQSYQLHLGVSGGRRGRLELIDITIEDRRDFIFDGADGVFDAYNVGNGQMLAGLDAGSVTNVAHAYLATFTYRASADAAGAFVVDVLHDEAVGDQTFLVAPAAGKIAVSGSRPAVVGVGGEPSASRR